MAVLATRGMSLPTSCPICNNEVESIIHTLKDCNVARQIWNTLSFPLDPNVFFNLNLVDWLRINCQSNKNHAVSNIPWGVIFPIGLWTLWLFRNKVVFKNKTSYRSLTSEILSKATEVAFIALNETTSAPQVTVQVRWIRPSVNWFKLNSDGSSLGNPGIAGGGGLIQNDRGEWIRGYARSIGITISAAAELWALRDSITLCFSLNLQAVEVELDAKLIVDLLGKDCGSANGNNTIVADCKEGLRQIPMVRIKHYYRKANKWADALARRGSFVGP